MVKQEWKNIFHNTWMKVVIIAIIAIPSLYSCVFLGSMWDPYGHSGSIPVAVVNEDQDVIYHKQSLAVGEELVKNLKDNDSMDFHFVNADVAMKGLKEGQYYMIITIPHNFSKNATTLLEDHPQKMILNYTTNPGTNYIASKMDDSAIAKIKSEVSTSVTKTYAETIFDQISVLSDGLGEASDGTDQLSGGIHQLIDGNQTISQNLKVLSTSSLTFQDGASTLTKGLKDYTDGVVTVHNGVYQLKDGLDTLNASTAPLLTGIEKLDKGAGQLQAGITQYTTGVEDIYTGSQQLVSKSQELKNGAETLSTATQTLMKLNTQLNQKFSEYQTHTTTGNISAATEDMKAIQTLQKSVTVITANLNSSVNGQDSIYYVLDEQGQPIFKNNQPLTTHIPNEKSLVYGVNAYLQGVGQVDAGLNQLKQKNTDLRKGSQDLKDGMTLLKKQTPTLMSGVEALDKGANTLYQGTSSLVSNHSTLINGTYTLTNGAGQISNGAKQLAAGSSVLGTGLTTVNGGVTTLNTRLKDGANKSKMSTNELTFDMLASPVETTHNEISTVENNGHAMAPYMMSVALYVTGLAFTLMYPILEGAKEAESGWKYWLSKATVMFTVSTIAAIIMITCLRCINGFEPQQLLLTYLFAILVSAAFMALIVLLNVTTGYIGEFLLLVFMIINLGGSAGTYPLETSSGFFKAIHHFVPYTYSVNGFRKVISMANVSIATETFIFVGILIVCSLLTIAYYHFKQNKAEHLIPQAFEKHE